MCKFKTPIITFLFFVGIAVSGQAQSGHELASNYRVVAEKNGVDKVRSVSNEVKVESNFKVYIPNAFSPDGDGINEKFGPVARGVREFSMAIYNRWGEKLFETNDPEKQWDGTYQGEKVKPGTYVYQISLKSTGQNHFQKEGHVTVLR